MMSSESRADRAFSPGRMVMLTCLAIALGAYAVAFTAPDPKLQTLGWKTGNWLLGMAIGYFTDQAVFYYLRPHALTGSSRDIAALRRVFLMTGAGYCLAMGL
jgi:hypothetical protein